MTVASVAPAVQAAGRDLRRKLIDLALADPRSPLADLSSEGMMLEDGVMYAHGDSTRREALAAIIARHRDVLEAQAQAQAKPDADEEHFATRSFGAVFPEVRIDEALGVIHVPRLVAGYSVRRVLNAKTALSQLQGGIVW